MQPDLFGGLETIIHPGTKRKPRLKHHEDAFLQEALEYIVGTYKGQC